MKKVAVVILHYKNLANTTKAVASVVKNILPKDYEMDIIVVDNASDEPFVLHKTEVPMRVIRNDDNRGFSGGMNVGINDALVHGAKYIIILNNDTEVDKHFVKELVEHADVPNTGIVVPKIYFYPESEFHKDRYDVSDYGKVIWYAGGKVDWKNVLVSHRGVDEVDHGQYDTVTQTEFATGCCMLIKADLMQEIGFFDELYFVYYEDIDFSLRVKKHGYKIVFSPTSILWHKNAKSAGGPGSALHDYFMTRNRLLFGLRYAPFRAKLALMKEAFRFLSIGRKWQKRGVVDYFKGRFGKGSYPL